MTLSSCVVSSMSVINCVDGIKICGGDAVVKACSIKGCKGSGIVFHGSTSKSAVSNASIESCFTGVSCLQGSIVYVSNSSIVRCGGSGMISQHNCNIFFDSVTVEGVLENIVALAEFCSLKISKCKLQGAVGAGVIVSAQSSVVINDSTISDCGGAGVESAGNTSMSSSTCSRNGSGVVLLQLTEANLANCTFSDNNLSGIWSIGDVCEVVGCVIEGNRCCAYTAGKETKFVEEQCQLLANGSNASFLMWKTGKRSIAVQVPWIAF
jgi:hypothetical protein